MQANINAAVIDSFFSVKPMTPDLREIFPAIDQRRLKRNSSAVWRTPPRYSQMPKY
jgi:inner centromere protein